MKMPKNSIRTRMEQQHISGPLLASLASTPQSPVYPYDAYMWRDGKPIAAHKAARLLKALTSVEKLLQIHGSIRLDLTDHQWVSEAVAMLDAIQAQRIIPSVLRVGAVSAKTADDSTIWAALQEQ